MSVTYTPKQLRNDAEPLVRGVTIAWTSDGSGNYTESFDLAGVILGVVTNPGSTAPTDNYDVTCPDADGRDVFMGGGADRDTANTENFVPLATGSDGTTKMPVAVAGTLTLTIANAGSAKVGTVTIYYR
jgi:hypothetical protein